MDEMFSGSEMNLTDSCFDKDYVKKFTKFLDQLLQSSIENNAQNEGVQNKTPLFVFVSKKGYWIYRLVERCLNEKSAWAQALHTGSIEVKSDRYFTKMTSPQEMSLMLEDRWIYVVDDFLIRGKNLARFYESIQNVAHGSQIIPVVFTRWKKFHPTNYETFFNGGKSISLGSVASLHEIGRQSIWETQEFFRRGIPYVIDLPFFQAANNSSKDFFNVVLTKAQFEQLTDNAGSNWQYRDTSCWIGNYFAKSGFFYYPNDLFVEKFRYLIHSLVVECVYNETDEEHVSLTFTPFAILRSIRQDELICRFRIAFSGTEYEEVVRQCLEDPQITVDDEKVNTALYRSVVFFFSVYIANNFKKHLFNLFEIPLELDSNALRDHWTEKFIRSLSRILEEDVNERFNQLYKKDDITPYTPSLNSDWYDRSDNLYYNLFAHFSFNRMNGVQGEFCSFEELENVAAAHSKHTDALSFRLEFTSVILKLLNQGVISNRISYDRDTGFVRRGFRSGENSTLLLPWNQNAVFNAIHTYYYLLCEDTDSGDDRRVFARYYRYYPQLKTRLMKYIEDSELDVYLNVEEAKDILNYFGEIEADKLEQQMENKEYIIDFLKQSSGVDSDVAQILEQVVLHMDFE